MSRDAARWRLGAGAALAAVLGASAAGCIRLDGFLYDPAPAAANADLLAGATQVPPARRHEIRTVRAADGTQVNTWVMDHEAGDGTNADHHGQGVLYCHGNTQNVAFFAGRAQALWLLGYTVILFDYRGYGKTLGVPDELGVVSDARAVRGFVHDALGLPRERLALYGYSLGAAVCAELAQDAAPPALLLEAPFASVSELVHDNIALQVPSAWFVDTVMDTRGTVASYGGALLVMHGTDDRFVQPRYGEEIFASAAAAQPRVLYLAQGADHESVPCRLPHEHDCESGFSAAYLAHVDGLLAAALGS